MARSVSQPVRMRRYLPLLILVLLLGLLLRVWFWYDQARAWNVVLGDEEEYYRGAIHILLQGDYYDTGLWLRPPVTSLYLAGAFAAFGVDLPLALLLETGMSLLSISLTATLVRNMFRREDYAVIASACVAFFLPYAAYASRILSETFFVAFLILSMVLLERAQARLRANISADAMLLLSGVALGLSIVTRAFLFYYTVLLFLWLWVVRRRLSAALRSFVPLALGAIIVVAPWIIRNSLVYNQLVFVDTMSGYNFLSGADPGANYEELQTYWLKAYSNSADRQRAQFAAGIEIVRRAPLQWIGRMRDKVVGLWRLEIRSLANNAMSGATAQLESVGFSLLSDIEYVGLMVTALLGLVVTRRDRLFLPLLGLPFYTTFVCAVTLTRPRYREPVMIFAIVYAALVLANPSAAWRELIRASRMAKLCLSVALGAFLLLIYTSAYLGFFQGQLWLGLARIGQGEPAIRQAIAADPDNVLPYLELGKFELARGNPAAALAALTLGNHVMPDNTQVQAGLIQVLRLRGDMAGARAALKPIADVGWDNPQWYEWGWERVAFAPRGEIDLGAPAVGVMRGVYATVMEAGVPYRWTTDRADFRLAQPGAKELTLRLRADRAVGVQVYFDGELLSTLQASPTWSDYVLPLGRAATDQSLVEIRVPTHVMSVDDPYARGVAVAEVKLDVVQ